MKYKKLKFSAVLLLGLGLTRLQAQTMYLKEQSGTQTAYMLSNIKKMSFSSGNISVSKTSGSPDTYSLDGIRYLNFKDLSTNIAMPKILEGAILLYPNPVYELLNINLSVSGNQSGFIEIFSMDGKVVYNEKIIQHDDVYQINVSSLPKGLYLCMINNGISIEISKFLKQ